MNYNSAKRAKGEGELRLINSEKAKTKGELIQKRRIKYFSYAFYCQKKKANSKGEGELI